jgi:hypothetical protein
MGGVSEDRGKGRRGEKGKRRKGEIARRFILSFSSSPLLPFTARSLDRWWPNVIRPQPLMELLLGPALHCLGRIVLREQVKQRPPRFLDFGCVGLHLHALRDGRGAGGNQRVEVSDPDETEATSASRFEPVIVTKRGNLDAGGAGGL